MNSSISTENKSVAGEGIKEDEGYEWVIDEEEGVPKRKKIEDRTKVRVLNVQANDGTFVMPGQKLAVANEYFEAGEGAYEFANVIYAAIVGKVCIEKFPEQELTVVSVKRKGKAPFISPTIGSIVTCTVVNRTYGLARCLITHVEDVELDDTMRGIIRREYITDKNRDAAEIQSSFGVGDIILARVVGIGEGDFIMSTSEDALGVASATSPAGYQMIPIDWTTMECPVSKARVSRKVAKIVQPQILKSEPS
ncbi:unnamed protein product [Allacma fusca]|uniref:Exosome complex component N-terminal domain-containing protein n=1 Tax=Allacma fusca TaxID=39272 RepID=A0A8J2KFS9_9HEXA|nr:unnamed protein product [Allacma fusca]